MSKTITLGALSAVGVALGLYALAPRAQAGDGQTVSTGPVIRGITVGGGGTPGQKLDGIDCANFQDEEVDSSGRMNEASVQCRPGGTEGNTLIGLPPRFDAYCIIADVAKLKGGQLIQAPIPDKNKNHCLLSGITPKDAQKQFRGAKWR